MGRKSRQFTIGAVPCQKQDGAANQVGEDLAAKRRVGGLSTPRLWLLWVEGFGIQANSLYICSNRCNCGYVLKYIYKHSAANVISVSGVKEIGDKNCSFRGFESSPEESQLSGITRLQAPVEV